VVQQATSAAGGCTTQHCLQLRDVDAVQSVSGPYPMRLQARHRLVPQTRPGLRDPCALLLAWCASGTARQRGRWPSRLPGSRRSQSKVMLGRTNLNMYQHCHLRRSELQQKATQYATAGQPCKGTVRCQPCDDCSCAYVFQQVVPTLPARRLCQTAAKIFLESCVQCQHMTRP
jgi:hypothetical protein